MKELLSFSKELEIDFVNTNPNYQSKMDLAITSLVTGEYKKSKELFDSAIEMDSLFPAAWIGKAFSEIALVSDEDFNSLKIDEYLNRALRTTENLTKYKVALAGCLAYRHSVIILNYTKIVESALRQQREAELQRNFALVAAVVGAVVSGKEKSIASNIVGASLITGGIGYAIHSQLEANEYSFLGNSNYRAALTQCYLSAPLIHLCGTLIDKIEDKQLEDSFNVVLESWKESIIYLFHCQRKQLLNKLNSFNVNKASDILLILGPRKIQEVGEFITFSKVIGLSNHKLIDIIETLFGTTLINIFKDERQIEALESFIWWEDYKNYILGALVIATLYFIGRTNDMDSFFHFFLIGCSIAIWYILKPKKIIEMREFATEYRTAIKNFSQIYIDKRDIKLKQI